MTQHRRWRPRPARVVVAVSLAIASALLPCSTVAQNVIVSLTDPAPNAALAISSAVTVAWSVQDASTDPATSPATTPFDLNSDLQISLMDDTTQYVLASVPVSSQKRRIVLPAAAMKPGSYQLLLSQQSTNAGPVSVPVTLTPADTNGKGVGGVLRGAGNSDATNGAKILVFGRIVPIAVFMGVCVTVGFALVVVLTSVVANGMRRQTVRQLEIDAEEEWNNAKRAGRAHAANAAAICPPTAPAAAGGSGASTIVEMSGSQFPFGILSGNSAVTNPKGAKWSPTKGQAIKASHGASLSPARAGGLSPSGGGGVRPARDVNGK